MVQSRAGNAGGYIEAVREFSPNARLFLVYSILSELGTGIWSVMFNLYLLRIGFPISFVGAFDVGGGLGAALAGLLVVDGVFLQAFIAAAVLILVPSVLYYVFFHQMETGPRERATMLAGVPSAAGV